MVVEQDEKFVALQLKVIGKQHNECQEEQLALYKKIFGEYSNIYIYLLTKCYNHYFKIILFIVSFF